MNAVARGYRMPCPAHCAPDIYRVMAECWQELPLDRPMFSHLVQKLSQLHSEAVNIPEGECFIVFILTTTAGVSLSV